MTYYAFFDTAVNTYLIERGGLDIQGGEVIGLVVSSSCDYFAPVAFPSGSRWACGWRAWATARCSTNWPCSSKEREACAAGRFVHVFVERRSSRPVAIPQGLRDALAALQSAAQ